MQFEKHYFKRGKFRLCYYRLGKGMPLIFIHGAGVRALTYYSLLVALSLKFEIIALDLPGMGSSSLPSFNWDYGNFNRLFNDFLNYLKIDNITVMGHSLGGGLALNWVVVNPKISQLILIDSVGIPPSFSQKQIFYRFYILKMFNDIWENKLGFLKVLRLIMDYSGNRLKHFSKWSQLSMLANKLINNKFKQYQKIKIPTLIIWGDKDELFPLSFAKIMQQKISQSTLKIVKGNHDWCLFKPTLAQEIIVNWLGNKKY